MITTSFGAVRVLDAHTHFFSRGFFTALAGQVALRGADPAGEVATRLGWEAAPADPADVARKWVAEMDKHGVDRMISIHTLPGDADSAGRGIRAAGGRLAGFVMVNPTEENAADNLRKAVNDHGFRGVALFPAMFRFPIISDAAYSIFQVAHEHELLVFLHCGVLKVPFRSKLGLPCVFDASLANPLALQRPAGEFPRARFIIPHLGSGYFRELLMLCDQVANVYADTSGVNGWAKYLHGFPTKAQVLRQAVEVMGAGRLLFGSDSTYFPRGWRRDVFDEQLVLFQEARLTAEEAAQILGGNLQKLIGSPA